MDAVDILNERIAVLKAERTRLVLELREARDCVESWGAYAAEYFQEKWGLANDIARFDAVLADFTDVPKAPIE